MTAETAVSVFQIVPRRSQRLHCSPDIGMSLALRSKHNIAAGQAHTDERRQGSHGRLEYMMSSISIARNEPFRDRSPR
jgi:hypothetical protein